MQSRRSGDIRAPALLHAAVPRRSWGCLDLALDLLVLPLSYVLLNVIVIIVISAFGPHDFRPALLTIGLIDILALTAYVCRGWMLSGIGIVGFWDLLRVPGFLIWKLLVIRFQPKANTWIRTTRER